MSDEMDEIWALFADDGAQAMDAMESALLALEGLAVADQAPHVAALFRAVHTFKGNSRVLGLGVVESRAHLAEDLIGLVRDQGVPLDAEIHALLLETADRLRDMLDTTASTHADVDPAATEPLAERLRDKIRRCSGAEDGATEALAQIPPEGTHDDGATGSQDEAPTPEPAPAPENSPVGAEPEAQLARPDTEAPEPLAPDSASAAPAVTRLADDPAYRAIFDGMVSDALSRLRGFAEGGTPERAARVVADLDHAARQLGLAEWSGALAEMATETGTIDIDAAIARIESLSAQSVPANGSGATAETELSPERGFFAHAEPAPSALSRIGLNYSTGAAPDASALAAAVETLVAAAEAQGYVRVIAAVQALSKAASASDYRRAELALYEELASVETVLADSAEPCGFSPAVLLAGWCADHIFDTLDELDSTLERMRRGGDMDDAQRALGRLVRLVHHACRFYGLEMASQLAMSLLDLFDRGHARGDAPDAILMRIARGFVDTLELVFDALREGEVPDTDRLEQLFNEASEAGFTGAGVMTATAIERKLGLPVEFHRVLSPESTRAAADAIARDMNFHLLRADVNSDNDMAEALFGFIGSGAIIAITNVTVFRGAETLFDFLIATGLDDFELSEALARMDPGGQRLALLRKLVIEADPSGDAAPKAADAPDTGADAPAGIDLSAGLLEQIGEIAAGQAMVHGMLTELAESDLAETIEALLRLHGDNPREARIALKGLAEGMMDRLRDLAQLETQLLGHLAELQQNTADLRSRPAETVLRPLAALTATQSRTNGREARMTSAGGDAMLDIALLDSLKRILRPLVIERIGLGDAAPTRLHVIVNRSDDQLAVTLEDDGSAPAPRALPDAVEAEIARTGGQVRQVRLPGGGHRFHIVLPLNMVVMEGMVVGAGGTRYVLPVEAIRSILQPDPATLLTVSAQGGQRWLRLGEDEVIAVRALPGAAPGNSAAGSRQGGVHIVVGREGKSVAIPVDDLVGQQLVLLRPLRGVMSKLRNISGVALLSGGEVGMVLSPAALCGCDATGDVVEGALSH
jgi:two-component system chemotaxis sensor kinase CheA